MIHKFRPNNIRNQQTVYEGIDVDSGESIIAKVVEIHSQTCPNLLKKEQEILACFPIEIYPKRVSSNHYFEFQPDPEVDGLIASMLILPKIEGEDSGCWVEQQGPIDQAKAIAWINKLMPYLKRLREMAVLHRDIKPSNIIVGNNESLTLIDYGAARKQDDEYMAIISGEVVDSSSQEYRKITRVFSPGYTSPEQNQGKPIPQSDFFSLGRTVMYWISGKSPDELIDLDTNQIDWSRLESFHKFDHCFLEFLSQLTHTNPARRPLTLNDIEVFLNEQLPNILQLEQQRKSKRSRLLRTQLISFGILGAVSIGWWGVTQFFLIQAKQSIYANDHQRALKELKVARSLNPFSKEVIRQQAYAHLWNNEPVLAKKKFEQALKRDPNDVGVLYHLGILNENLDKLPEAQEFYKQSIDAQPVQIESQMRLAGIALRTNDLRQAEIYLKNAQNISRKHPQKEQPTDKYFLNFYLGWLEFEKKNFESASIYLETALKNEIDDNTILSVRTGDLICLLAETSTNIEIDGLIELWTECFRSPTATIIGSKIQQNRMNEFIINSFR